MSRFSDGFWLITIPAAAVAGHLALVCGAVWLVPGKGEQWPHMLGPLLLVGVYTWPWLPGIAAYLVTRAVLHRRRAPTARPTHADGRECRR